MALAAYKNLWLIIAGYAVKLLWSWHDLPTLPKIIGGLLFCVCAYNLIDNYIGESFRGVFFFIAGMLTNNLITTVFRWSKVNEDELLERTRRWWNSDKK